MGVEANLEDNRDGVKESFRQAAVAWLYEACGELASAVRSNQRVRTGRTRQSWRYLVDEDKQEGCIASDAENAVWEEFGTGEYALNGNGRKGGWFYRDERGVSHFTRGKKPQRPLYKAYMALKNVIIASAKERFKGM
ncbi:MAG: HK97 gp10 family phage protein [Lachnospiraceae bacterium]|nr:HK97 gp10 family phage protein [Butyrivibrio sp.]MCM1344023.1 hypothetical protein [Muribaculaceae bacterium]MCM1411510.1 HK97 gp10 family phage protein [Lachnospiraceae bacterium]